MRALTSKTTLTNRLKNTLPSKHSVVNTKPSKTVLQFLQHNCSSSLQTKLALHSV